MAFVKSERNKAKEQDPKVRARNFKEVSYGFTKEQAMNEASRCLNCKGAPCKSGCPVGVNIPEFLAELRSGDTRAAAKIIKATNSLPAICGRVCPQESQCEKLCLRAKVDSAVSIGGCERFVGDYAVENGIDAQAGGEKVSGKVAVIGSGPAGLTCASVLSSRGVDVTIFEAFHKAGGVLVYGIPEFRLPKSLVEKEIESVLKKGAKMELNTVAGKTVTIDELKEEFDAIFIGSGAGLPVFLGIEGENLNGVMSANEYLTRVNLMGAYKDDSLTPVQKGRNVAVIGAGNVAMDAARTALRMGAEKVTIVYRRSREEMPARAEEIHHAIEEGVELNLLTAPLKMNGENGWVKSMECRKMELGEPDESGRRSPVPIMGSEYTLETDMVIVALGTSPNPLITDSYSELKTSKRGTLIVNEENETTSSGVYAGGDAVTGAATVILAMGAGRKAANAILNKLSAK